jgi:hypothetical protein
MLGGNIMSKRKKKESPSAWSIDMLEEFRDHLVNSLLPYIRFVIKERVNRIYLTNTLHKYHSYFIGELAGFEDVYCGLSSLDNLIEEYRDYMGYIEILNGNSERDEPVPMVRGFIKKDITFFESVSKMAIESRLLNPNNLMNLIIGVNPSGLKNIPAENILNIKLPITTIEIAQLLSFV